MMKFLILVLVCIASSFAESLQSDPYRPQYHVMPEKNWMNDPNGPIYYKGYYHLFYQYNPNAAVWGDMHWGHAVSQDLAHWKHLPTALFPDRPYDKGGVFSGSAVLLDDGTPMIVYTGQTNIEVQCVAYPNDTNDPLLLNWHKPAYNPIIPKPPPQGNQQDFRDPVTPWKQGNIWHLVTGCNFNNVGASLLWTSMDLKTWNFSNVLYSNNKYGSVWECPDFFQAPDSPSHHIAKWSGNGQDFWAVGTYNPSAKTWAPLQGAATVLCDAGRYYASKSFYDPIKKRQINWGWVAEEDSAGPSRGWQGLQSFPCTVTVDPIFKIPLVSPIEELALLRGERLISVHVKLEPNEVHQLQVQNNQIEINATFQAEGQEPFGLRVLSSSTVWTTIVFTRISPTQASLYVDRSQSGSTGSRSNQGGTFPVQASEKFFTIHVLVDHSVVEAYEGEGRMRITSRLYTPPNALGVSLFSGSVTTTKVEVWPIKSIWQ